MGQWMSTAATAASGTKAASSPRKRYKGLRKYRCYTATGEGPVMACTRVVVDQSRSRVLACAAFAAARSATTAAGAC